MIAAMNTWIRETQLNFRFEMISFLAHRVTGLGLVLYVVIHIFSLGTRMISPEAFNNTMKSYDTTLFHFAEWGLFMACVFHAVNGLRIIFVDFFPLTRQQKEMTFWVFGLTAVLGAFSALFFFESVRNAVSAIPMF